jgi:hypothetical protein
MGFYYNLTRITSTLHEDVYKFVVVSRCILLRMRTVSDKAVEKVKTHSVFNIFF